MPPAIPWSPSSGKVYYATHAFVGVLKSVFVLVRVCQAYRLICLFDFSFRFCFVSFCFVLLFFVLFFVLLLFCFSFLVFVLSMFFSLFVVSFAFQLNPPLRRPSASKLRLSSNAAVWYCLANLV